MPHCPFFHFRVWGRAVSWCWCRFRGISLSSFENLRANEENWEGRPWFVRAPLPMALPPTKLPPTQTVPPLPRYRPPAMNRGHSHIARARGLAHHAPCACTPCPDPPRADEHHRSEPRRPHERAVEYRRTSTQQRALLAASTVGVHNVMWRGRTKTFLNETLVY